jgi:predicted NBD/HSP70 family sugar kinase
MTILAENGLNTLKLIRANPRIVRSELAQRLNVSLSLATKITAGLMDGGLIRETGYAGSEVGGRHPSLLSLNPAAGYAIGIEMDPRRLVGVIVDLCGGLVASIEDPPPALENRPAVLDCLSDFSGRLVSLAKVPAEKVFGISVCLPRTVDPVSGVTKGWHAVSGWEDIWEDFPLRAALEPRLGLAHVWVDDVVRALGLAEAHYGSGNLKEDFIYLLLDDGIGMAFMVAGTPYLGYSHIAMEIGHVPVQGRDVRCACGNTGCLQELASISAVQHRFSERMNETPIQSSLRRNGRLPDIQEILQAAENNDKLAYPLLIEVGEDIGKVLGILVNLLGPRLVVAGGTLAESKVLLEAARRETKLRALQQAAQTVEIQASQLDRLAAARGAATQILNALLEPGPKNLLELHHIA